MSLLNLRRGAALAVGLALVVSGIAFADTIVTDGDSVSVGNQTSVNLGALAPGEARSVSVAFVLTCKSSGHLAAGTTVDLVAGSTSVADGGTMSVSPGTVDVPATWPATGELCTSADTPVRSTTPARIDITAPTAPGLGFHFDVVFVPDPDDGVVSNTTAFTIYLDVVEPVPTDTTPPTLDGMPASMTVFTSGTSATVTWTGPTATDDTDPAPLVACAPASGSTFGLGTTTVACTATDAAGNSASATFDVTVIQLAATWGRPLSSSTPALVGHAGRTVPVKLSIVAGGAVQGPGDTDAPALRVAPLAGCTADAAAGASSGVGTFAWADGTWKIRLSTASMGAGCWRLTATVDDAPLAMAVIELDGTVPAARRR